MLSDRIERAKRGSPFLGVFGAALAVGNLVLWIRTGDASYLAAACAFAAMTPAWYLLALSFTQPIGAELRRARAAGLPKWARTLSMVGAALLFVSVAIRVVATISA
jgi:hypothetical protein